MPVLPSRRVLAAVAVPLALGLALTAAAPGLVHVRVHRGDTLWAIAHRHHTSVQALVRLNDLPGNGNLIYAGQVLRVPVTRPARPARRMVEKVYVVRSGDGLYAVAKRFGADWREVARRNHLPASLMLYIGQHLVVPVPAPDPPATAHAYPVAVVAAADRHRSALAHRAVPSRSQVRRIVAATARRYGVDPSLAVALAYQESGFNQRMVSPADAVGAMQVLPATGRYVSRYVVGRSLDLLDARDNVTAGVALLAQLLRAAPTKLAVAGYYQGLRSVRTHGMYADTRRYVANVLALRGSFPRG